MLDRVPEVTVNPVEGVLLREPLSDTLRVIEDFPVSSLAESKAYKASALGRISFMTNIESIAQSFTTRNSPRRLYHVTPVTNLISIHERGVDPAFSKSHPDRIYFVEYSCLFWAIPFIAKKHKCQIDDLIIFQAHGSKGCKSLSNGKWYCNHSKKAHFWDRAVNHVK